MSLLKNEVIEDLQLDGLKIIQKHQKIQIYK